MCNIRIIIQKKNVSYSFIKCIILKYYYLLLYIPIKITLVAFHFNNLNITIYYTVNHYIVVKINT